MPWPDEYIKYEAVAEVAHAWARARGIVLRQQSTAKGPIVGFTSTEDEVRHDKALKQLLYDAGLVHIVSQKRWEADGTSDREQNAVYDHSISKRAFVLRLAAFRERYPELALLEW